MIIAQYMVDVAMRIEKVFDRQLADCNEMIQFALLLRFITTRINNNRFACFIKYNQRILLKCIKDKCLNHHHLDKGTKVWKFFSPVAGLSAEFQNFSFYPAGLTHSRKVDYLIVGLGLAGACLSIHLLRRKKSILVIDQPRNNRSTVVAAGLMNPIAGKMFAKTWYAEKLFPYSRAFYNDLERQVNRRLFFPMPLYRPFKGAEEQNEWMGRSTQPEMKEYIEEIFLKPAFSEEVFDPFGGVLVRQSSYVDTNEFLEGVRTLLKVENAYEEALFNDHELDAIEPQIVYHNIRAKKLIHCGGTDDTRSRYFSWLPIIPLKGETLLVEMSPLKRIYNKGVYVVPAVGKGRYHVGATYDFKVTSGVTSLGRIELESRLRELIRLPYEIINQDWGIRPTTHDRKPILGPHPSHENLVIFNGLGTKGVLSAPYFSAHLAAWLEGEGEIIPEVNIRRYKSLYSKFD